MAQDISLSLVRKLKAAPEKVFEAWTDPQTLKRWMGPSEDMTVPLAESDPKVGGRYRIVMREANGTEHKVGGVYRIVDPPRKLAFTWAWEGSSDPETLVTIELRASAGGTEMTLTHTKFGTESARDLHGQGWAGCLNKLERLMAA